MEIYIGVDGDADLTVRDSESGLWINALPDGEHHGRTALEVDRVFEVGSFMGCSCGLSFGDWSKEDANEEHDRRVANVVAFREVLSANAAAISGIVTFSEFTVFAREEFPLLPLDLEAMSSGVAAFDLHSDTLYELWPEASVGVP